MAPLTPDLIVEPQYCRLDLRLSDEALDVMLYNPLEEGSLILRSFPLPDDETKRLRAIETAVYDNPLLLSDFKSVTAIIATGASTIVPTQLLDKLTPLEALSAINPEIPASATTLVDSLPEFGASIITALPCQVDNFLRRTFHGITIQSAFYPFTFYCRNNLSKGNTIKAFVNIRPHSLDIAVMSQTSLKLINRFAYTDAQNAVYYILAATTESVDGDVNEIYIAGDHQARDAVMQPLRRFRPYVMPMIFPSEMFRAGAGAISAPFDLVIMPLLS